MAGTIEVESSSGMVKRAGSRGAQLQQGQRIDLAQADMLGEFVLALVQIVVGHLHAS